LHIRYRIGKLNVKNVLYFDSGSLFTEHWAGVPAEEGLSHSSPRLRAVADDAEKERGSR
jgi:hypothetical protein